MKKVKYGILDTDFISKAAVIKANKHSLADEILSFPNYRFFCHQYMKQEISKSKITALQQWLGEKIDRGYIICYSDKQILLQLSRHISHRCFSYYRSFLKKGCDMFSASFYINHFQALDDFDSDIVNKEQIDAFLVILKNCEAQIKSQQSYGEIKAFVLAQFLRFVFDAEACVFCSDDYGARYGFANLGQIPCISILSVFLKLVFIGYPKEKIDPYFNSYILWYTESVNYQGYVKVWTFSSGTNRRIKVNLNPILDDMFAGKYAARRDGDLQKIN